MRGLRPFDAGLIDVQGTQVYSGLNTFDWNNTCIVHYVNLIPFYLFNLICMNTFNSICQNIHLILGTGISPGIRKIRAWEKIIEYCYNWLAIYINNKIANMYMHIMLWSPFKINKARQPLSCLIFTGFTTLTNNNNNKPNNIITKRKIKDYNNL